MLPLPVMRTLPPPVEVAPPLSKTAKVGGAGSISCAGDGYGTAGTYRTSDIDAVIVARAAAAACACDGDVAAVPGGHTPAELDAEVGCTRTIACAGNRDRAARTDCGAGAGNDSIIRPCAVRAARTGEVIVLYSPPSHSPRV